MVSLDEIPSSGDRYSLEESIGCGVYGKVFSATDSRASNKKVAIKVQKLGSETTSYIEQEYKILRDLSSHANLPDFYGIYRNDEEIWFVMELCEGGPITELINDLLTKNRRMVEEHIAYVLKEVVKALVYLHHHHVMHRDIRASNILLTREGEVKLTDFGLSHNLQSTFDKTASFLGSPGWMAPEVILSAKNQDLYGSRSDVWSLGITAIEIGDGKAPYESMHPTRALFQIVTDPPPTLRGISNWSANYTDFVTECLEKNPEHRPFMVEIAEHPFLEQIPDNNYHLSLELKSLLIDKNVSSGFVPSEVIVNGEYLRRGIDGSMEKMHVEDLASLNSISEQTVMAEVEERWKIGEYQTFVGDVLLVLNPTEDKDIYGDQYHKKYQQKSRSDNAPHIYAVADSAYQDALHHVVTQRILLAGESGSGKTRNYLHLIDHLLYLGDNKNINLTRLKNGIKLIHALIHASTPINYYSTRCLFKTEIKFGSSGKVSGAAFNVLALEKWRVSSVDMFQGNFHFFYYVYDGLSAANKLEQYELESGRQYRYLRITEQDQSEIDHNASKFKTLLKIFEEFEFSSEEKDMVLSITAAILNIGEIRFQPDEDSAFIENQEMVTKVALLLKIERKKLAWALINYCLVHDGQAVKRKSTVDEARDARDVFANTLYTRLVDYIVGVINHKFAVGSAIFGEKYSVKIFDHFGFECFKKNHLPQLLANSLNEQLQYHYLQRNFSWECLDINVEDVRYTPFQYYDNKNTLDSLLGKSEGILNVIDQASKIGRNGKYVMEFIHNQESECIAGGSRAHEFTVAHYTGKVTYDIKEMPDKNRDFLPPEIIETMRLSDDRICHSLFSNKLNKFGNLIINFEDNCTSKKQYRSESPAGSSANQYSQIRKMRTYMAAFKAVSLDLLKELSIGSGSGGTHFVRCIRPTLKKKHEFHEQLVKQQLRALAVVATAKERQRGFPHRIPFAEFLQRYKFLAFDFDENVDINKDNCRLLLVRLKLEGWAIGKTKVFLKYYHEEYLSRLYETQVRKIVKIQSILRGFLTKCRMAQRAKVMQEHILRRASIVTGQMSEEEAALIIQKAYRGVGLKKPYGELSKEYKVLNEEQCNFVRGYARKWRCNSMFHVLLQYRAMRLHDIFNLAQQVHLYNLNVFHNVRQINESVYGVDTKAQVAVWLGESKLSVLKMPFRLDEIPFYDTTNMRDLLTNTGTSSDRDDSWDTPYRWRKLTSTNIPEEVENYGSFDEELTRLPYNRDPEKPLHQLADEEADAVTKDVKNEENKFVRNKDKQKQTTAIPNNKQTRKVEPKIFENNMKNKMEFVSKKETNSNSKPANEDFDFIRPPITIKPRYTSADPVAELKKIGGKATGNEDDPPFNFQGMLRKTNYGNRETVKPIESTRTFSFKKKLIKVNMNGMNEENNENNVSFELAPGIIVEGIEVEL